MPLTIPNTIANSIAADGNDVGANFSAIETWADTVDASLAGAIPTGAIQMFATGVIPTGFLLCDGSAVSRTTYAGLFSVLGTAYGSGDGTTTFNVPNLKGRFPIGVDASVTALNAVAKTGGSRNAIVVAHTHTGPSHTHSFSDTTSSDAHTHTTNIDHNHPTVSTDSQGLHNHGFSGSQSVWIQSGTGTALGIDASNKALSSAYVQNTDSGGTHTHNVNLPALGTQNVTSSSDAHTHTVSGTTGSGGTGNTGSTGASGTDANMPPFLVVNFIIKT